MHWLLTVSSSGFGAHCATQCTMRSVVVTAGNCAKARASTMTGLYKLAHTLQSKLVGKVSGLDACASMDCADPQPAVGAGGFIDHTPNTFAVLCCSAGCAWLTLLIME